MGKDVAGQYDRILQYDTYGIKVTVEGNAGAGSVNDYDGLNSELFRIPEAEMSVDGLFKQEGIRIDQSKLNSADGMDGPEPESRAAVQFVKIGTSTCGQSDGWIYSGNLNRVVLHTPISITTTIKKYARDSAQTTLKHDNEPVTLGTPFEVKLDYVGDFSNVGYGTVDTHQFVLEDDTAYFTYPFPVYAETNGGEAKYHEKDTTLGNMWEIIWIYKIEDI